MLVMIVHDRLPLPRLDPMVTRDTPIVLVDSSVTLLPGVELRRSQAGPSQQATDWQLRAFRERRQEIDHGIPDVGGDPSTLQLSPRLFFSSTYSSDTSAMMRS